MFWQYTELRPINGWELLASLGTPGNFKFQWVSCLSFDTAATSLTGRQPNIARCLAISCASIYIFGGLLAPNGILPAAIFTLRPNLVFSYIGSVRPTARLSSTGRKPNFMALSRGPLAAEICWRVWGTPAHLNGFRVLAALLQGTLVVGVSQTLQRWTEVATYIRQGGHHFGHCPTF